MSEGTGTNIIKARLIAKIITTAIMPYCEKWEVAGSIRRQCAVVNDIDIVLIPKAGVMDDIKRVCLQYHPDFDASVPAPKWGAKLATFSYQGKIGVDLYFADEHSWPVILMIRTGSREHNVNLTTKAKSMGMFLAAEGALYADREKEKRIPVTSEGDIYGALDLCYLDPEDRSFTE